MYHRIAEESFDPWGLAVSPERFSTQLSWLSEKRTVLPLAEFAERHRHGTLRENTIAITMDDGYSCNAEVAAPLLEHISLPATIFLPVQLIEQGEAFWWDELELIVFENDTGAVAFDGEETVLGEKRADDRTWNFGSPPRTPRQSAYQELYATLAGKSSTDRSVSLRQLRSAAGEPRLLRKRPMSPEQVRRVASSLVEFGSHALTHEWLTKLGPEAQATEIRDSMKRCSALTGSRPTSFAYPYGDFDSRSERLVEEAGFTCACSVEHATVSAESRTFALPRLQVGNWNAAGLEWALATL